MPITDAQLASEQTAAEKGVESEAGAIAELSRQQAGNRAAEEQALAGPREAASKAAEAVSTEAEKPPPASEVEQLGDFTPTKINPKHIQELSWGLIGMALIGGAASHGNWLGVSASLNGAMKGIIDGDIERAKREWEDFNHKFQVAEAHDKKATDALEKVMANKNMSLKAKMQEYQLIADKYDLQDVRIAAEAKLHDAVMKQYEAKVASRESLRVRMQDAANSVNARLSGAGGVDDKGNVKLPPGFKQKDIDYYAIQQILGQTSWRTGLSRTARGANIISAVDARVPGLAESLGLGPAEAATLHDVRTSLARALNDRQKYGATLDQFMLNFDKQAGIVEKYLEPGVGGSTPVFNRWIQAGRKAVAGDGDVTALDTALVGLGREHQRIVTGVTSNAQLQQGAADTADRLVNIDMNAEMIRNDLKVMKEEAKNAGDAGREERANLQYQLNHMLPERPGIGTKPDGEKPGEHAPGPPVNAGPDEIVKWYREHPGG